MVLCAVTPTGLVPTFFTLYGDDVAEFVPYMTILNMLPEPFGHRSMPCALFKIPEGKEKEALIVIHHPRFFLIRYHLLRWYLAKETQLLEGGWLPA